MPVPLAYQLRRVDGEEPMGPYTLSEIRQRLYTRELTGRERVRVPGHDVPWVPLTEQEAFKDIIQLLDIQVHNTSRIKGWQAKTSATEPAPAPSEPPAPAPPAAPARPQGSRVPLVIAIVIALVVITTVVLSVAL